MAEREPYLSERDLAAAFAAYLEDAPTRVRPAELARHFATAYPHRRSLTGPWGLPMALRPAWILVLVGLLLVLVVGGLAVGALWADRTVVAPDRPQTTVVAAAIDVLPPGPTAYTKVVALSHDEVVVLGGAFLWHFDDGSWTATYRIGQDAWAFVADLTLAPDGTLWAAGPKGVAYFRDDGWVVADTHASSAVTVDRDGTVWVAGTESPCDIWSLRQSGGRWTRTSAGCTFSFGGDGRVHTMAVDGRGALWVGSAGYVVNALARYADGRWEAAEARAGLPEAMTVNTLRVTATGEILIDYQAAPTATRARARFDGAAWTAVAGAADMAVAVAPDGESWASALARHDWKELASSSPSVVAPLTPLVVAPDGTVFAVDGDASLVRVAAASPSP